MSFVLSSFQWVLTTSESIMRRLRRERERRPVHSGVCWWLKKGWGPADDLSTGMASSLRISAPITPHGTYFLSITLPSLLLPERVILGWWMYQEGKTRGNWITQFTWTVMYVCLLLSLFLFPLWGQCCWCMRQFVVGCRTTKPSTSCEDSCCSASMYSLKPTTQVSLTYWCTLNYRWFQNFHMCSVCL